MGVFLIILIIIALLWPYIMRWLRRYLMRKAEDHLRQMAGQPTRKQEERMRRDRERQQSRGRKRRRGPQHPARELNKVAEDVQFTEIQEFSESTIDIHEDSGNERRDYHEEQVEDVKYTEIKTDSK